MSNAPSFLPYGRHSIDDADVAEVIRVLQSDWLTTGPDVEEFEKALAAYCGARHAIAVNSATSALHLAMRAARVGPGDRVITSPNTFVASANCAAFVGATPDFADIDERTYNLSPDVLREQWRGGVRAVVTVDFAGQPCDFPAIAETARRNGAVIIEDACHAIGGTFRRDGATHKIGHHPWSDMTVFSFHPVKTITTGEGGALLTDNDDYADRARHLRSHGLVRERERFVGFGAGPDEFGPWHYEMHDLGYNYRITDFQCALGRSQLGKLDRFVARRAEIVRRYNDAFAKLPHIVIPFADPSARPAWHLYVLQIDFVALGKSRTQVMARLRERGVGTQVHYIPVHLQPYYRRTYGYGPGKCPVAESYYRRCLSLPLFPAMSDADVERVIQAVSAVIAA